MVVQPDGKGERSQRSERRRVLLARAGRVFAVEENIGAEATANRLLWYLVPPLELVKNIRKVFR